MRGAIHRSAWRKFSEVRIQDNYMSGMEFITTSTFTKSARELAKSTRVKLIDGKELAEWLEGMREQEESALCSPDDLES